MHCDWKCEVDRHLRCINITKCLNVHVLVKTGEKKLRSLLKKGKEYCVLNILIKEEKVGWILFPGKHKVENSQMH